MKASHLVLLLLLNCGWAAVPAFATRVQGQIGPVEFIFLRYGFALAGLLVIWPWLGGSLPRGRDFWRTCAMGVAVFTVGHLCQIAGIQRSQACDSSILLTLDPLVSTLGAAWFLHEKIPARRWTGFVVAMTGVAVMSAWNRTSPLPGLIANLLIVLSFVSESVWSVVGKPLISRWGIPKVSVLALTAGTIANGLLMLSWPSAEPGAFARLPVSSWIILAVLGVVFTAFGYNVWFLVIREAPVSVASLTIFLQPIVGTVVSVLWTGERLHTGHLLGSTAIVAGLLLGLSGPAAQTVQRRPTQD